MDKSEAFIWLVSAYQPRIWDQFVFLQLSAATIIIYFIMDMTIFFYLPYYISVDVINWRPFWIPLFKQDVSLCVEISTLPHAKALYHPTPQHASNETISASSFSPSYTHWTYLMYFWYWSDQINIELNPIILFLNFVYILTELWNCDNINRGCISLIGVSATR